MRNWPGDILYCSNAFKKFFYPVFEEIVDQHSSASKQFTLDGHMENFKRSLDLETRTRSDRFVITLQEKLDSLILIVTKQFTVEETEVNIFIFLSTFSLFALFSVFRFQFTHCFLGIPHHQRELQH